MCGSSEERDWRQLPAPIATAYLREIRSSTLTMGGTLRPCLRPLVWDMRCIVPRMVSSWIMDILFPQIEEQWSFTDCGLLIGRERFMYI